MSILKNKVFIQSVGFGDDKMYIESNSSKVLTVPYTYTKRLNNATLSELKNYRLIGNEIKRINISVQANFLDLADSYAKEHHLSRSTLIQKATLEYMAS